MVILEEEVWQKHAWSVSGRTGSCRLQEAAPQESPGQKYPRWVSMRSTSSTQQTAQLFKIIITFMEHAMEMKGGHIIGEEMEMDHDTRWKVEVQSLRRTKKNTFQRGCEGQWTVGWNKRNKGGKCPLDRRRWKVRKCSWKLEAEGGGMAAGERLWLATKEETRVCAACQYKYSVSQGLPSR